MNRWSGQQIGKYEVKELLGRGGTGEVYKAWHPALARDVAIKTIHTFSDEPKAIERFRREAQIIAALRHPNIVQVHDFDIANDTFYMVMEHVAGQSLQSYLKPIHARGETLPLTEALTLFQTICRAVIYAHSHGVVHADLKPANVLLDMSNQPILVDFGLSRLAGHERVTQSNALTGTPAYMAPEQCMSKGSDERSDIYSLGVMLFEMVTGSLPFTGDSIVAIILKHIDEPPPFPRTFNPDLPFELEDVILRALEKEPARRFQTVSELLEALDNVIVPLGGLPSVLFDQNEPLPEDAQPCYRGLQPFEEEHAAYYFGRESLVRQLLQRMEGMVQGVGDGTNAPGRFLAVLGASGSGKSSLIRAGLIPQIRAGAIADSATWQIRLLKPGQRPLTTLINTLYTLVSNQEQTAVGVAQQLYKDGRSLNRIFSETHPGQKLCLVVDQFEELFTVCSDENERRLFIENLLYAAAVSNGPIFILLTMRADFYHRCAAYSDLAHRIASQQILVGGMSPAELRQAIVQPAQHAGLKLEPGLVDTILDDVAWQPGALPLLQHALLELWQRRQGRLLTLRGYHASGGVQGAIAQRANDVYYGLPDAQRTILRRIMLRLTELGDEGGQATSRRASPAEFIARDTDPNTIASVLRTLADARLVTLGDDTVEVAHEALIRSWPALHEWLEEDREGLRIHQHLSEAAQAWAELNRDPGELYRGLRLARASEWASDHDDVLNPIERSFLQSSQQLAEARAAEEETQRQRELAQAQELAELSQQRAELQARGNQRLRLLLAAVGVLLLAAVGTLWFANTQRQLVDARRLAFAAEAQADTDPETAVLLAYEAIGRRQDYQTEQALRDALRQISWQPQTLAGHGGVLLQAVFSPDGSHLLTTSADGTAQLWSSDGLLLETLAGHEDEVVNGRFSPDGTLIVTASADGTARLWDRNGNPLATLSGHADALIDALFTPDGQNIVTASADGTAQLWTLAGESVVLFDGHEGEELTAVALSPDGTHLVTADASGVAVLWQLDGTAVATLPAHDEAIVVVGFAPDGQTFLTGSEDKKARLWDLSGKMVTQFDHDEVLTTAAFLPDGSAILTSAGRENRLRLWHLDGSQRAAFYGHTRKINSIAFAPSGQELLTGSEDGTVRLWQLNGQLVTTLRGHTDNITNATFSPDGRLIVTSSDDGTARLWRPANTPTPALIGHTDEVENAVYSENGRFILTASTDKTARLWDSNGNTLTTFVGHEGQVDTAYFSPDQRYIVTASEDGTARLWDVNGNQLALLQHEDEVGGAYFSPDGQLVLTYSNDKTARLWTLQGIEIARVEHGNELQMAQFSPDGQLVVSTDEDGVTKVWDLQGHERVVVEHGEKTNTAFFSPNGQTFLTSGEDFVARLWNLQGEEIATFADHTDELERAVFSPDGKMVATSGKDRTGKLWTVDGKLVATLTGHTNVVKWIDFSPDSQKVVTASDDGTVRLWNLQGELLTIFRDHENWVATAVFSSDGTRIVTASRDYTARQFMVNVEDVVKTAVCQVSRTLTESEIERFQVGTATLDLQARQCPPVYSWNE
ncbi:MAG: protein kinase [Chloroflexota bacterium]